MPVPSCVGGKRVSAACVFLGSVFTKTLLHVPTNNFFHKVLHNANIFDINELLLSEAMD
jgi:hypothetical protein